MPYDEGNLVASAEAVHRKVAHASGQARITEQAEAGVAAFTFSTFGTDPKRFPRIPAPLLADCFAAAARTGLAAGIHNEDGDYFRTAMDKVRASGVTGYRAHGLPPPLTELLAMLQIYEIGAATGCPAHVVRCSLSRGYEIAAGHRAQDYAATVECLIHYLMLDEETDARRLSGQSRCNPPLRSRVEVESLWRHTMAGSVIFASTDHVSWSLDRQSDPNMLANASGLSGLEMLVPLFIKGALERGIPLTWAVRLMAENPARHFRIDHVKGAFAVGKDADITVLTPELTIFEAEKIGHSTSAGRRSTARSCRIKSPRPMRGAASPLTVRMFWSSPPIGEGPPCRSRRSTRAV